MKTVCLDPGHSGPIEPGACNRETGLKECDVVLKACRMLASKLSSAKICPILTRNGDIDDDGLTWRANFSNENNADLFVSLHCNAAENPAAHGFEVWTSPGDTGSDEAATKMFFSMVHAFPYMSAREDQSDGDPDKESRFTVLTATDCPAVLVEMAFISNQEEAELLADDAFLCKMTDAIAAGIVNYFGEVE